MAEPDHDAVHALLRAAMADDAVPDAVLAEAELIPHTVRLEADLAALLETSALVRADDAVALYSVGDVHITVTPEPGGIVVEVDGLDDPVVELLTADGRVVAERSGAHFRIVTQYAGPARVIVDSSDRSVATDWFTLG